MTDGQIISTSVVIMGNANSSLLPDGVPEGFSRDEVSRLEKRFHKLDLDRSGAISIKEFLSVPELKENPLVQRVVDVLDSDLNGEVDFKGMCNDFSMHYSRHKLFPIWQKDAGVRT